MSDRLELVPAPTPLESAVVQTALTEAQLLGARGQATGSAWRQAGVEESVARAPQAPSLRSSRGAARA